MPAISVQFDRLDLGQKQFKGSFIAPAHKNAVASYLSNYILNFGLAPNHKVPFRVDLADESLVLDGKRVSLDGGLRLKDRAKIAQYYQHVGFLPRKEITPKDALLRRKTTKAAVRAMHEMSIPGTEGKILAGVGIVDETLSAARNIATAVVGHGNPVVNHLGYYAGMIWGFFALKEVDGGRKDLERAKVIGDEEGKTRAKARLVSGGLVSTASAVYLAGRVFDSLESATAAASVLGAANILFGVGTILSSGLSYLGWTRCHTFNERLNDYLENKNLSEVQRLQGALRFLQEKIAVTPGEIEALRGEIVKEHPELNAAEKEALLKQALTHLAEKKVKYLKRRTSHKSLQLIQAQVDRILAKLDDEKTRSEGIKEATLLIGKVQNENRIKMALFVLSFIASLISILGLLIATFLSAGVAPFVLYGISGAIYLALQVYTSAGIFMKKGPDAGTATDTDAVPLESIQMVH